MDFRPTYELWASKYASAKGVPIKTVRLQNYHEGALDINPKSLITLARLYISGGIKGSTNGRAISVFQIQSAYWYAYYEKLAGKGAYARDEVAIDLEFDKMKLMSQTKSIKSDQSDIPPLLTKIIDGFLILPVKIFNPRTSMLGMMASNAHDSVAGKMSSVELAICTHTFGYTTPGLNYSFFNHISDTIKPNPLCYYTAPIEFVFDAFCNYIAAHVNSSNPDDVKRFPDAFKGLGVTTNQIRSSMVADGYTFDVEVLDALTKKYPTIFASICRAKHGYTAHKLDSTFLSHPEIMTMMRRSGHLASNVTGKTILYYCNGVKQTSQRTNGFTNSLTLSSRPAGCTLEEFKTFYPTVDIITEVMKSNLTTQYTDPFEDKKAIVIPNDNISRQPVLAESVVQPTNQVNVDMSEGKVSQPINYLWDFYAIK